MRHPFNRLNLKRYDRGFAFLIVLPQILVAVVLAAVIAQGVRSVATSPRFSHDELAGDLAVEAALNAEIFRRLEAQIKTEAGLSDSVQKWLDSKRVNVSVDRESSKMSLLSSQLLTLKRLIQVLCISDTAASKIVAFADTYRRGGQSGAGQSLSRRFETLGAWRNQIGLPLEAYTALRPYITIYGYHDRPILAGARIPVIMATENVGPDAAEVLRQTSNAEGVDTVGILTVTAQQSSVDQHPRNLSAVVYFTGNPAKLVQVLEYRRNINLSESSGCRPGVSERRF